MTTISEAPQVHIPVNYYELIYIIDSLHETLMKRLRIALEDENFRLSVDIRFMGTPISTLTALFQRSWQIYNDLLTPELQTDVDRRWEIMRSVPDEVWNVILAITQAESWEEVPIHRILPKHCVVCDVINQATPA